MSAFPTSPQPSMIAMRSRMANFTDYAMSGARFSRNFGAHRWEMDVAFSVQNRASMDPIVAFALSQLGSYNIFTFNCHDRQTPQGIATGTPLVNGAGQTGSSLVTDGWTASKTGIMKAGDLILVSGSTKVYWVTADANSNASGQATLSIFPSLLASPADNAAITVTAVPFTVSFDGDIQQYQADVPGFYTYAMKLIEAL